MNKSDLQSLVDIRVSEATTLIKSNNFHGAYYLAGYALECAIKACIAKKVQQYDFPNKKLAEDSYSHDLQKLIGAAGLKQELENKENSDEDFKLNWAVAKDWSEQARYDHNIEEKSANDLYRAVTEERYGVLAWLKTYW